MENLTKKETISLMMEKANKIYKDGWSWDAEMEIWSICSEWNSEHDEDEIAMYEHSDENNIVNGFYIEDDVWVFDRE